MQVGYWCKELGPLKREQSPCPGGRSPCTELWIIPYLQFTLVAHCQLNFQVFLLELYNIFLMWMVFFWNLIFQFVLQNRSALTERCFCCVAPEVTLMKAGWHWDTQRKRSWGGSMDSETGLKPGLLTSTARYFKKGGRWWRSKGEEKQGRWLLGCPLCSVGCFMFLELSFFNCNAKKKFDYMIVLAPLSLLFAVLGL